MSGPWWPCKPAARWLRSGTALLLLGAANAFSPDAKDELRAAVLEWASGVLPGSYGGQNISQWDVSGVHDMNYLFCAFKDSSSPLDVCDGIKANFNGDISGWNVAKVTTMQCVSHSLSSLCPFQGRW